MTLVFGRNLAPVAAGCAVSQLNFYSYTGIIDSKHATPCRTSNQSLISLMLDSKVQKQSGNRIGMRLFFVTHFHQPKSRILVDLQGCLNHLLAQGSHLRRIVLCLAWHPILMETYTLTTSEKKQAVECCWVLISCDMSSDRMETD